MGEYPSASHLYCSCGVKAPSQILRLRSTRYDSRRTKTKGRSEVREGKRNVIQLRWLNLLGSFGPMASHRPSGLALATKQLDFTALLLLSDFD